jgi:adenylosuccinate lyase
MPSAILIKSVLYLYGKKLNVCVLDEPVHGLLDICTACATLAEQHRSTLMIGRTLLQQALPITFGLKAARWLALATRQVRTLRERQERSLALQLGGAAGTLASLGNDGLHVVELLAGELGLPAPELPWHTERDRIAEIATTLGVIAGAMAKIVTTWRCWHRPRLARYRREPRQAALADTQVHGALSPEEIKRAFDPGAYLGSTNIFIERALASYREVRRSSRGGCRIQSAGGPGGE